MLNVYGDFTFQFSRYNDGGLQDASVNVHGNAFFSGGGFFLQDASMLV